ncbi:glycolate oxidase iron-sulfur subunit [Caldalkalibacillus thermarum]|uniref:(Fe-S)-binding protein n=1 Tax=Caldalkalibacillus thermarum TaxID=296745 RepID=UPI001667317F|nr:(Fe-S)-binding protein [Caldalkalibacillus thermarum]GGK34525.1 glycolate oxidase iron-sulfur subunit [Caldalkalibacillus thermarum]
MKDKDLQHLQQLIGYEKTFDCVQCGYCLPACPTYETMGKETHSPRGRINLMKQAAEGTVSLEAIREPIEKCLGCRACETVCPADVDYGHLLEGTKAALTEQMPQSWSARMLSTILYDRIFPSRYWMGILGYVMWLYQRTGLSWVLRRTGLLRLIPERFRSFEAVLPAVIRPGLKQLSDQFKIKRDADAIWIRGEKSSGLRVGFFTGCIMDALFHETNLNTITLLLQIGAEVVIPRRQTCCGALHAHSGFREKAKSLAKQNISVFDQFGLDYVIHNAGGCGAMLVEYDIILEEDETWRSRAEAFASQAKDISWFLATQSNLKFKRTLPYKVTYQSSCHMLHVQKAADYPLQLLNQIPGLELHMMKDYERCCGSAGIYNVVHYDESMNILDTKMENVKNTTADVIVTTNPGCLLQMKLGVKREGLQNQVKVMHIVDLLAEAMPISTYPEKAET